MKKDKNQTDHKFEKDDGSSYLDLQFHYKREERLNMPSAPRHFVGKGGAFRKNRSLLFILFDVLILVVIIFIIYRVVFVYNTDKNNYQGNLAGYSVVLYVYPQDDLALVMVAVSKLASTPETAEDRIYIRFYYEDSDIQEFVSERLPKTEDQRVNVRTSLPARDERIISAEVHIGDEKMVLSRE